MKIRHQLKYDAAPEQVYTMLSDPAFRKLVCEARRTVSHNITFEHGDASMSVRIDMLQRTRGVPGFARKIVGEETRIIQAEQWTDQRGADLELEIPGKPGHLRGRLSLTGDAAGTVESFEGEAKVSIPLIGGKLEGLIERLFIQGMDTEQTVGTGWLSGER